jgi:hypothetical protein
MLGTPVALPDGNCAPDAAGSIAMSKGAMNLIGLSSGFHLGFVALSLKSTTVLFKSKKITFQRSTL